MNAQAIYDALIAHLDQSPATTSYWDNTAATGWDTDRWTATMTAALVAAVEQVAAGTPAFIRAAKNHPDPYGRSEYLNIDVMGLVDDWSRPLVAIEHENNPGGPKLRYCLWKLLVVGAPASVLVCYIDGTGTFGGCFSSFADLRAVLDEVLVAHPGRLAHVIVGEWNASAAGGWNQVFTLHPL